MNLASQVTGKNLFDGWGLENSRDTPAQPLVRPYKKVDIPKGAIWDTLETICDVCDALKKQGKNESKGRLDLVLITHTIIFFYLLFVTI